MDDKSGAPPSDVHTIIRLQETNRSSSSSYMDNAHTPLLQQRPATKFNMTGDDHHTTTSIYANNNNSNAANNNKSYSTNISNFNEGYAPTTLKEKLHHHYHHGHTSGSRSKVFARIVFQFQGITFFFMTMFYIAPFVLEEYNAFIKISLNLFFIYIFIMAETNWLYSILTDSFLPPRIDDEPPQTSELDTLQNLNLTLNNASTDSSSTSATTTAPITVMPRVDKYGLIWKYCQKCNRFRPPRTYHCKFCRKCVMRRDHHCHMIGKCIGHYNQRYFIVLCFYTLLASAIGFPVATVYLSHLDEAESWTYYIIPYTFILFIFRYVSWKFTLLTFHVYMLFIFGILSLLYWLSQLSLISTGKTLVEVVKQMDMRVTSSLSDNFSVVFGNYWFLSFLIPLQIVFKQKHDGINFKHVKIYGKKKDDV